MFLPVKARCKRCQHEWIPRVQKPRQCPGCHTVFWDIESGFERLRPNSPIEIVPVEQEALGQVSPSEVKYNNNIISEAEQRESQEMTTS